MPSSEKIISPGDPPRYCLSKNKGALIHSLPAGKTIFCSTSNIMDQRKKLGYMWVHPRHFGKLSPGVRPFPQNPPIFQNRRFSRIYTYSGGHMCPGGTARGKYIFPPATPPRYCLSTKKGALSPLKK